MSLHDFHDAPLAHWRRHAKRSGVGLLSTRTAWATRAYNAGVLAATSEEEAEKEVTREASTRSTPAFGPVNRWSLGSLVWRLVRLRKPPDTDVANGFLMKRAHFSSAGQSTTISPCGRLQRKQFSQRLSHRCPTSQVHPWVWERTFENHADAIIFALELEQSTWPYSRLRNSTSR